jgi:amino-acid N-acetyltransferase
LLLTFHMVGSVGLERFGRKGLLRSLVVARTARDVGIGGQLLTHAENLARASGISELWLLTTTAAPFFRRAGYAEGDRSRAPKELQGSTQFAQLYPASADCMAKLLDPDMADDPIAGL